MLLNIFFCRNYIMVVTSSKRSPVIKGLEHMVALVFALVTIIVLIFMTVASFYQFTTRVFQILQNIYFAMQVLVQIAIL